MYKFNEDKLYKPFSNDLDNPKPLFFLKKILLKDSSFLWMSVVYGLVISLLALAVPISVQLLINSVSFTAMIQPVIILGTVLFIILVFSGVLNALQFYVTEIFQRRFFSRMAAEVGMSLLNAEYKTFEEANQTEMVNRFFEAVTIQKTIPKFLTKTFSVFLQAIVGLVLVTFYHPIFLVFSLLVIASLWLIWSIYYEKALVSSFYESRRKYDIVGWLEDIARGNMIFKSSPGYDYAKSKIDFLTGQYLKERKKKFISVFSQVVLLLTLYALASVLLLVVGGWLVLKGQLTIGQLVAAELILSSVLYGFSQFGRDFENFYDLVASCEKLSQFQNIPSDKKGGEEVKEEAWDIAFSEVYYKYLDREYRFSVNFESGKNYVISTGGFSTKKIFLDLICGFRDPIYGSIEINGADVRSYDPYSFRSKIGIIDNSNLIEGTLEEYLTFGNQEIPQSLINWALKVTDLDRVVLKSKDGLNLRIIPSGWPFSESEKILLKIARILIHKPKVIIITEALDMLVLAARKKILHYLTKEHDATVIYFSHRVDDMMGFDEYLFLEKIRHHSFSSIEELDQFERKQTSK